MKTNALVFLLSSLLFLQPKLATSQNYEIETGSEFTASHSQSFRFLAKDQSTYYYVQYNGPFSNPVQQRVYLKTLDKDLNPTSEKIVSLGKGKEAESLEFAITSKQKKSFILSSRTDRKERIHYLFSRKVNYEDFSLPTEGEVVVRTPFEGNSFFSNARYILRASRDSSKFLVYTKLSSKKNDPEKFYFVVFDDEMKLIWEKEIILPFSDRLFKVQEARIDNKGNIYLLGKRYRDKLKELVKGLPNYYHSLFFINKDGISDEFKVVTKEKILTDMNLGIVNGQDIICSGVFREEESKKQGVFYFRVDAKDKGIIAKSYKYLDVSMIGSKYEQEKINEQTNQKKKEKMEEELFKYYTFRDLVLREDGGSILIGESTYASVDGTKYESRTETRYYADFILLVLIDPQGEIEGTKLIQKAQTQLNSTRFISYSLSIHQNRLFFLFNDHIKNSNLKEGEGPWTYVAGALGTKANSGLSLTKFEDGELAERKFLSSFAELDNFWVLPSISSQAFDGESLLILRKKNKVKFGRVKY